MTFSLSWSIEKIKHILSCKMAELRVKYLKQVIQLDIENISNYKMARLKAQYNEQFDC
jgi:hypothetical protein